MTAKQIVSRVVVDSYDPNDGKIHFHSDDGLRAIVRYDRFDEGFRIYASGDTTYGLIAFWLYYSLKDGEPPNIVEFGLPSDA